MKKHLPSSPLLFLVLGALTFSSCAAAGAATPQDPLVERTDEIAEPEPEPAHLESASADDDRSANLEESGEQNLEVIGQLDREIIQHVVRSNRDAIRDCYESELIQNPELAGYILTQWTISASGIVVSARAIETTLDSPEVELCIAEEIKTWTFPEIESGGIVRVNYPFHFNF